MSQESDREEISEAVDGSFLEVSLVQDVKSQDFSCDLCGKKVTTKSHLIRHMKTHDETAKATRCSDCNVFFKNEEAMQDHTATKHDSNICEVCGKLFKRKRDLEVHSKLHAVNEANHVDESLPICPFEGCRKVFSRKIT
jgi:uncharacterized Zn-finger protein